MNRFEKITIKCKDIETDAILDRVEEKITFHFNSFIVETTKSGQVLSKTPFGEDRKRYYNSTDICHDPCEYIKKKDCNNCHLITICCCELNKYRINKYDEKLVVKITGEIIE